MPANLDLVQRLVRADHGLAVVAAVRGDGTVQASVVNAGIVDDPVDAGPAVAFVARGDARKLALLRRRPRAAVVFRAAWEWAAVEGPVTLIGPDDHPVGWDPSRLSRLLRDIFTAAGGTHDNWEEYDRVMAAERRTAVFVRPHRISSNG
jgi:PPOX class probable F420-dependent enzyme